MTPTEIDDFLRRCPQIVVGALDVHGWPTGTLAALDTTGVRPVVRFAADDPMFEELPARADDDSLDVCCVADEHARYAEIRGVILRARLNRVADDPSRFELSFQRVLSFDFGRIP